MLCAVHAAFWEPQGLAQRGADDTLLIWYTAALFVLVAMRCPETTARPLQLPTPNILTYVEWERLALCHHVDPRLAIAVLLLFLFFAASGCAILFRAAFGATTTTTPTGLACHVAVLGIITLWAYVQLCCHLLRVPTAAHHVRFVRKDPSPRTTVLHRQTFVLPELTDDCELEIPMPVVHVSMRYEDLMGAFGKQGNSSLAE